MDTESAVGAFRNSRMKMKPYLMYGIHLIRVRSLFSSYSVAWIPVVMSDYHDSIMKKAFLK
jgi:hypothetical protein